MKYKWIIFLMFFLRMKSIFSVEIGLTLDQETSASSRALGSSSASIPEGLLHSKLNPAQLVFIQSAGFLGKFNHYIFENNYVGFSAAWRLYGIPIAFSYDMGLPIYFSEINDEGFEGPRDSIYEITSGISSAWTFKIYGHALHVGIGSKLFYKKFLFQTLYSVASDIGILFPFSIDPIKFFSMRGAYNFHLSFTALNFGPPVSYPDSKEHLPSSIQIGINWTILSSRDHKIDLSNSGKMYTFADDFSSSIEYSLGLQYIVLNSLFIRSSLFKSYDQLGINVGGGLRYPFHHSHYFQVDYNFQPIISLGDTHQVSFKVSLDYSIKKSRVFDKDDPALRAKAFPDYEDVLFLKDGNKMEVNKLEETKEDILVEHEFGKLRIYKEQIEYMFSKKMLMIDEEIINTIQDYIDKYKKENKHHPDSLEEVKIYLQELSVERLPQPSTGTLVYDRESGKINLKRKKLFR